MDAPKVKIMKGFLEQHPRLNILTLEMVECEVLPLRSLRILCASQGLRGFTEGTESGQTSQVKLRDRP